MAEYLDSLEPIKASLEKSPLLSTPCHHHISRHRFLPPITRSISQPMPSLPYHIETPFVFIIPTLSATVRKVRQSYRRPVAHTFSHLISSHRNPIRHQNRLRNCHRKLLQNRTRYHQQNVLQNCHH